MCGFRRVAFAARVIETSFTTSLGSCVRGRLLKRRSSGDGGDIALLTGSKLLNNAAKSH